MEIVQYILGAIILVLAIGLIVLIIFQQGKRKGLENVIAGNSSGNSFLNKTEAAKKGKRLEKVTIYVAIAFAVLVIALYATTVIKNKASESSDTSAESSVESSAEESSED